MARLGPEQHDGLKRRALHLRRRDRRTRALARQGLRAVRTAGQQLQTLDTRLGAAQGAQRERARLTATP